MSLAQGFARRGDNSRVLGLQGFAPVFWGMGFEGREEEVPGVLQSEGDWAREVQRYGSSMQQQQQQQTGCSCAARAEQQQSLIALCATSYTPAAAAAAAVPAAALSVLQAVPPALPPSSVASMSHQCFRVR